MARKINLLMGRMSQTPTPEKNVWEGEMWCIADKNSPEVDDQLAIQIKEITQAWRDSAAVNNRFSF